MFKQLQNPGLFAALLALGLAITLQAAEMHAGKIMSVEADKIIVIDMVDGESSAFAITPTTKITRKGETIKPVDLALGDSVKVAAETVEGKLVARTIDAMPSE